MKIKFYSKFILASLLCCIAVVFTSCDDIFASEDNPIASYLSMSDKDVTIKIGDTYKRTAIAVSGAVIEYSSSDEAVATVDNDGTVTGISVGDATITATATGYNTSGKKIYNAETLSYNVKVNPILVQSITITNPISTALFNETATLTANVSPANATDKSITWSSDNPSIATVDPNTGEITALTAGNAKITATANDASAKTATFTVIVGLLPGVFSVDNGTPAKKVQFAQGNLQATTTDLGVNWSWNFAANQWVAIGNETANYDIDGNGTVSDNGTVDLFGWVGNTSNTLTSGGAMYGISNSTNNDDYSTSTTDILKSDWGSTIGTGWRTLTENELSYLLFTRNASTIGNTDNARYAKAKLFGTTRGMILFPDNYTHPDGVANPTGINQYGSWDANQYTAEEWAKMETAGCVFLPAAGYRDNDNYGLVFDDNGRGRYWTSTVSDSYQGWGRCFTFKNNQVQFDHLECKRGHSVRLVYPAQ